MEYDAGKEGFNWFNLNIRLPYDVCIFGGGLAGITMVKRLSDSGKKVLLIESSKENEKVGTNDHWDQNPRFRDKFESIRGLDDGVLGNTFVKRVRDGKYLQQSRTRALGGSTNCWGGYLRPLDDYDFLNGNWPITRPEIERYYKEAYGLMLMDEAQYDKFDDTEYWLRYAGSGTLADFDGMDTYRAFLRRVVLQHQLGCQIEQDPGPAVGLNFQQKYADFLSSDKVTVVRNCTLLGLSEKQDSSDGIGGFRYGYLDKNSVPQQGSPPAGSPVIANKFVLALGGLETTRLLLNSDYQKQLPDLGKYYMNHPKYVCCASAVVPDAVFWTELAQRQNDFYGKENRYHRNDPRQDWPKNSFPKLQAVLAPSLLALNDRFMPVHNFRVSLNWREAIDSDAIKNARRLIVELNFEQVPNEKSVVRPANSYDMFSQKLLELDWQFRKEDAQTVNNSMTLIKRFIESLLLKNNNDWKLDKYWRQTEWDYDKDPFPPLFDIGYYDEKTERDVQFAIYTGDHHIGTCRMRPRDGTSSDGVVDSDCKLRMFSNVWLCSTAVFPSGGWANSSLTLLALALRLVDEQLKK